MDPGAPRRTSRGEARGLVPDAADEIKTGLRLKHAGGVGAIERRVRHRHRGQARSLPERRQPAGLGDGIPAVPLRFDMNGRRHVPALRIGRVLLRQIAVSQRPRIAVTKRARWRLVLQPGIAPTAEIPEMLMRVDDRGALHAGQDRRS